MGFLLQLLIVIVTIAGAIVGAELGVALAMGRPWTVHARRLAVAMLAIVAALGVAWASRP